MPSFYSLILDLRYNLMSRNRSHDPPATEEQMIPMSAVNSLIQSLQSKVEGLERKYLEFAHHCSKIIRAAQNSLDQSINEHVTSGNMPSSKFIETLTRQKDKLQGELKNIEKMSVDFGNKEEKLSISVRLMRIVAIAKERILDKIKENKVKYSVQSVLLSMEEKLCNVVTKMNISEYNKERISELEDIIKQKDQTYESLQQYVIKLKNEQPLGLNHVSSLTEFKQGKKLVSPSSTHRSSIGLGRTSPNLHTLQGTQQKDNEIAKLKNEISYLQEKFIGLTGKAEKLVVKKENEIFRFKNEMAQINNMKTMLKQVFRVFDDFEDKISVCLDKFGLKVNVLGKIYLRFESLKSSKYRSRLFIREDAQNINFIQGLEKIIEELKRELENKDEVLKHKNEELIKVSKLYSEINEKIQVNVRISKESTNETEKKRIIIEDLQKSNSDLKSELTRISNYKNELDLEIMDLKDYFQSDIDNLSNKIEKLFSENLLLKQRNEDLREKYEKVMTEKEKLMIQLYETKDTSSSDILSVKPESVRSPSNSALALKQELKITSTKLEAKSKEFNQLKADMKNIFVSVIHDLIKNYDELESNTTKKLMIMLQKCEAVLKLKHSRYRKVHHYASENYKNPNIFEKVNELTNSQSKLILINEKLTQKCNYYQDVIDQLNTHCKQLASEIPATQNCGKCLEYQKHLIEKDYLVSLLQETVMKLEKENQRLEQDVQNIEFTFQNFIADSKHEEENRSRKSKGVVISSTDLIKTFDSKSFERADSDVDLTYTLEGTTIKSMHGELAPLTLSDEEINDLESIH